MPSLIGNKRSTTLFEVIVSTVIFVLVMAGMVSVFIASKRNVAYTRDRMTSSEIGKVCLEPLGLAVRYDNWLVGDLSVGSHSFASQNINNVPYTVQYEVANVFGTDLRKVVATVHWDPN